MAAVIAAAISGITLSQVALSVGAALAGTALSVVASALLAEPVPQPAVGGISTGLSYSPREPRSLIVGRARTAGSLAYAQVGDHKGDNTSFSGARQNRFLDQVIALADHPCAGIVRVHVDGKNQSLGGSTGSLGQPVDGYSRDGKDWLHVRWFAGALNQSADPRLSAVAPNGQWNADHRGAGVAYARMTAQYHEKLFTSWPELDFVVDGAPFYDPRLDSTNGGTGAHRLADEATWAHTDNPAVMIHHLMQGYTVGGIHLAGFQGAVDLDLASFTAAMDDCYDQIPLKAGGNERRYRCGGEIKLGDDVTNRDILQTLLSTMAGELCWTGARWRLFAGKARSAVASISDDDVVIDDPRQHDPNTGLADLVNAVTTSYLEPAENWNIAAAPLRTSSVDEATDGGRRLTLDLQLDMVQSGTQAQRIGEIARRQARRQRVHTVTLPPQFFALEVGDWINWASSRWSYATKAFKIENAEVLPDLRVTLRLRETDAAVYAWDANTDELPRRFKDLDSAGPDDADVPAISFAPAIETGGRNSRATIEATWTDPDNRRIEGLQIHLRKQGATRWKNGGRFDAEDLTAAIQHGVQPATAYELRARWLFQAGRRGSWTTPQVVTTARLNDPASIPVPALTVSAIRTNSGGDGNRRVALRAVFTPPSSALLRRMDVQYRSQAEPTRVFRERVEDTADGHWTSDGHLLPATAYEVRARYVYDDDDRGNWSAWSAAVTTPSLRVPGSDPVPALTLTAGTYTKGGRVRPFIKATWAGAADAREIEFRYRETGSTEEWLTDSRKADATAWRGLKGVQPQETYDVQARWVFEDGQRGNWSATAVSPATADDTPPAPTGTPTYTVSADAVKGGKGSQRARIMLAFANPTGDTRVRGFVGAFRESSTARWRKIILPYDPAETSAEDLTLYIDQGIQRGTLYVTRAALLYEDLRRRGPWTAQQFVTTPTLGGSDVPALTITQIRTDSGGAGNRKVGLIVEWTPPTDDTIRAIRLKWQPVGHVGTPEHANFTDVADGSFEILGLLPVTGYQVAAQWLYTDQEPGPWSAWSGTVVTDPLRDGSEAAPALTLTTGNNLATSGARRPWIRVSWGTPDPDARQIEIRYRETGEAIAYMRERAAVGESSIRIPKGIQPGASYDFWARWVFEDGLTGAWSASPTTIVADANYRVPRLSVGSDELADKAVKSRHVRVTDNANLVPNGDFDDGADTWTLSAGAISYVTSGGYVGRGYMLLDRGSVGGAAVHLTSDYIPVEDNQVYRVGAYISGPGSSPAGAYVRVFLYDKDKVAWSTAFEDVAVDVGFSWAWSFAGGRYRPPAGVRYIRVREIHNTSSSLAQLRVGMVVVKRAATQNDIETKAIGSDELSNRAVTGSKLKFPGAENLVNVGDFEEGLEGWLVNDAVNIVAINSNSAPAGSYYIQMTRQAIDLWLADEVNVPVRAGNKYTIEAVLNASGPISAASTGARLRARWVDRSGALVDSTFVNVDVGTTWDEVGAVVTAPTGAKYCNVAVWHMASSPAARLYVGEVSFKKVVKERRLDENSVSDGKIKRSGTDRVRIRNVDLDRETGNRVKIDNVDLERTGANKLVVVEADVGNDEIGNSKVKRTGTNKLVVVTGDVAVDNISVSYENHNYTAVNPSSSAWVDLLDTGNQSFSGRTVKVSFCMAMRANTTLSCDVQIILDGATGSPLWSSTFSVNVQNGAIIIPATMFILHTPSAGSHRYQVRASVDTFGGMSFRDRAIVISEFKR